MGVLERRSESERSKAMKRSGDGGMVRGRQGWRLRQRSEKTSQACRVRSNEILW